MDYVRYLSAKRTVDDRALNEQVLTDLKVFLQDGSNQLQHSREIRVLEVGAGIGAMCMRLFQRRLFSNFAKVDYKLVDIKANLLQYARDNIIAMTHNPQQKDSSLGNDAETTTTKRGGGSAHSVHEEEWNSAQVTHLPSVQVNESFTVSFHVGDVIEFARDQKCTFDMVIAAAVLDLWHLDECIPVVLETLSENGLRLFYTPVNFDGTTHLFPPSSEGTSFDFSIEVAFHQAMGERETNTYKTPAAQTGRHLVPTIIQKGADILSAGSSSWMVYPQTFHKTHTTDKIGSYADDEAFFLHCIVDFIRDSVPSVAEDRDDAHWRDAFDRYIATRRSQIDNGQLYYVAHNIDVLACMPPTPTP